jgi:hypothetical protein
VLDYNWQSSFAALDLQLDPGRPEVRDAAEHSLDSKRRSLLIAPE